MKLNEVYLIDGVRSPIGRFRGSLSGIRIDDLVALNIKKALEKTPSIDPSQIDEVVLGCANQAGDDNRNLARMATLLAELPPEIPAYTVNRLCASGLSAVICGMRSIQVGDQNLVIVGGAESMTRAPYVLSKAEYPYSTKQEIFDTSLGWRFVNERLEKIYGSDPMGVTAENLVKKYKIKRSDQDKFALNSQFKAANATKIGRLSKEIFPVSIERKKENCILQEDETIRTDSKIEKLAQLLPVFEKNGTVTAGNSSPLSDGSCVLILASEQAVKSHNLKPLCRLTKTSEAGVLPREMGIGPVKAIEKVLAKEKSTLAKYDLIEINEAFAAQVLSCLKELNLDFEDERINPNGGAIALGHPLGMSGARLVLSSGYTLAEKKLKRAICSLCVGVGQGVALAMEKV